MKLLLDSCVWGKAADELRAVGHDVDWPEIGPQILVTTQFWLARMPTSGFS